MKRQIKVSLLICLISLCGCQTAFEPTKGGVTFADLYQKLETVQTPRMQSTEETRRLTLSVRDMTVPAFARYLANSAGLSMICDASLDAQKISIEAVDAPLDSVLSSVARRLGVSISRQGNLYYVGSLKPEDKAVLVRKCRRMNADDLNAAVATLLTDSGRSKAYADGLLVCSDTTKILQSVSGMLDGIEAAPANTWVIQLYLISFTDAAQKALGVQTDMTAKLAIDLAQPDSRVSGEITALLTASKKQDGVELLAQPLLLVLDGQTARIQDGQTLPVPKKAVSNEGTVTTQDYTMVETGIIAECLLREQTQTSASCTLTIQLTGVSGYVEDAPIISGQSYKSTLQIEAGKTYLAGSMSKQERGRTLTGTLFPSYFVRSQSAGLVQVWLRAYRIDAGGVDQAKAGKGISLPVDASKPENRGAGAEMRIALPEMPEMEEQAHP